MNGAFGPLDPSVAARPMFGQAPPGHGVRRQRGVALITALLTAALATVAAVQMASRQELDIRRTANVLNQDQAELYMIAAESWALGVLRKDARETEIDALGESWATELTPVSVEGGAVTGRLEDLQGRMNLNGLALEGPTGDENRARFVRLLKALDLEPGIADAVIDWVDPDVEPRGSEGAEDDEYQRRDPPYRTPNGPITSLTELRLIRGIDAQVFDKLRPNVTALPKATEINVNTAPKAVLMSLSETITEADAEQLVADRGEKGFKTIDEFIQHPALAGTGRGLQVVSLGLTSQYFLFSGEAQVGRSRVPLRSLIQRDQEQARVLFRSRGDDL